MNQTRLSHEQLWNSPKYPSYINRCKGIARFIDSLQEDILDIGEDNPLKRFMEKKFNVSISSTPYELDFDRDTIPGKWQTITCFEVLEHLFNPLTLLDNMVNTLEDDGVIYLSTPKRPHFLWTKYHYHEIDDKRIRWLFEKAGLKIVREDRIRTTGKWYQHLMGRGFLRYLIWYYTRIYELRKN